MRAAALGMVLLCLVSGCTKAHKTVTNSKTHKTVTNSIGMVLIEIPPGKFTMGSPEDERFREDRESQVSVTLTKPFWLGKTEVTQGQFKKVMGMAPWKGQDCVQIGEGNAATYVSWEEAKAFCDQLTELEQNAGKLKANEEYRLPTEAQWEYACRAGTKTTYSFGNEYKQLGQYARFAGNNAGERYAHTVGLKKPNPWGLFDMHGNVEEWCSDWYVEKLSGGVDPAGPGGGSIRGIRGGSWGSIPDYCRSAYRGYLVPLLRDYSLGFRVARSQSETVAARRQQGAQAEPAPQVAAAKRPIQLEANSIGMKLVKLPAGKFTMGEGGSAVTVTLTKPFLMGTTEVTQGQFKNVMGTEPWLNQDSVQIGEDNTATYVSWDDATAFCQKLTKREQKSASRYKLKVGEVYRLPTDAEWEYACRAGTKTAYSFGDDEKQLGQYAWFDGNTAGEQYAHTVGLKKPNPWGLHDMHGSVWEWCSDWGDEKLSGGTDPAGPGGGSDRVIRGGGRGDYPDDCRSAIRGPSVPSDRFDYLGFRVARSQSAE